MPTRAANSRMYVECPRLADPSTNVSALVTLEAAHQAEMRESESRRQDDLRIAAKGFAASHTVHEHELAAMREGHAKEMAAKESSRVDSLRQGDREEGIRNASAAQANIAALAVTTGALAENLRNQVKVTADAAEIRQSSYSGDVGKRLTAVELSLSEGKGKQTLADPQMERLSALVEKLGERAQVGQGKVEGIDTFWKVLVVLVTLFFAWSAWQSRAAGPSIQPQYPALPPYFYYAPAPPGAGLPPPGPR